MLQNFMEVGFPLQKIVAEGVEQDIVEYVIFEKDRGAGTQDILLVGDEGVGVMVFGGLSLGEAIEVVVTDDSFLEDDQVLFDVIDEGVDMLACSGWIFEVHFDEHNKESHDATQHAVFVSKMFLQDVGKFNEYLKIFCCLFENFLILRQG